VFLVYVYRAVHQPLDKAPFLKVIDFGESHHIYGSA